jgi:short-subunit dehydrogenase
MPTPKSAAYSGGKSFSFYYGVALYQELKNMGSKVTVTVLCPPPTKTGFAKAAGMDHLGTFDDKSSMVQSAEFVAGEGYKAMMKGKRMVSPGRIGRWVTQMINPLARSRRAVLAMKVAEWGSK